MEVVVMLQGVYLGRAYRFRWRNSELTGIATGVTGHEQWVQLRTGAGLFTVPPEDVHEYADHREPMSQHFVYLVAIGDVSPA